LSPVQVNPARKNIHGTVLSPSACGGRYIFRFIFEPITLDVCESLTSFPPKEAIVEVVSNVIVKHF
jgi:hypothetical protein